MQRLADDPQASDPRADTRRLRNAFFIAAAFTLLLWVIQLIGSLAATDLVELGIYPGEPLSLIGIVLAPLIHGSWSHLFANTAPLLLLGTALVYGYPKSSRIVIPMVYLVTGFCVWLFARPAYHIGASGLTFGFMFFVFVVGALRWDKRAIVLSMIVFFLYGSMIWGVLPTDPSISYESHLYGALTGTILAVVLRNHDPRMPEKRYSWEDEDEDPEQQHDERTLH